MRKLAILGLFLLFCAGLNANKITLYTCLEQERQDAYMRLFRADHPEIVVDVVTFTASDLSRALASERNAPVADVVWGVPSMYLLFMANNFEPYTPSGLNNIDSLFFDQSDPPRWVGTSLWSPTLLVNYDTIHSLGLKTPLAWADLSGEEYRGLISVASPLHSDTAATLLLFLKNKLSESDLWKYYQSLQDNTGYQAMDGADAAEAVRDGRMPVGICPDFAAGRVIKMNSSVRTVDLGKNIPWEMEINALVKRDDVKPEAKVFMDYITGLTYLAAQEASFSQSVRKGFKNPADIKILSHDQLPDYSHVNASRQRSRLMQSWGQRFAPEDINNETEKGN